MTEDLLRKFITSVEESGYEVHATVCDMGGTNYSLLNKLGINEVQNSFTNPYDPNRNVHVFADAPHLIKLV